jgi:3-oxoacyl-[acyl-carrier protein] reductase
LDSSAARATFDTPHPAFDTRLSTFPMDLNLEGKTVVVTGAAGRLGRLLAEHLARDGATIVALVRNEAEAQDIPFPEEAEGWAFPVDLADERLVAATFGQIGQQFGAIDALIHAAGGWASHPLLETTLDQWDDQLRRNLTSTFLCFREAARLMTGRRGRLIAFAAGQGVDRGPAQQAAYAAAKAGVARLVEATAAELAGTGITAHAIAPSSILYDAGGEAKGVSAVELLRLCRFLLTPAGDALNGSTLRAYGNA